MQNTRQSHRLCAGRDYVLRRVLRRGVRYGQDTLKAPAGFFHGLVDSVVASMGHFYPELVKARDHIVEVIRCLFACELIVRYAWHVMLSILVDSSFKLQNCCHIQDLPTPRDAAGTSSCVRPSDPYSPQDVMLAESSLTQTQAFMAAKSYAAAFVPTLC